MRIVFIGTSDFAVESLKVLVENDYQVVGVVTAPDKPAGRGLKFQFSPVKQYALEHNLPVLTPYDLKEPEFLSNLRNLQADVQVVVAFRMLPEVVWDMPSLGTFNLHASLLPQYRGAAPINHAIINGETKTGVTTFFLTHEIDTGKIILQEEIDIAPEDNAGSLHDKLMLMGAQMVKKTIDMLIEGKTDAVDQSHFYTAETTLQPAPKIFRETCELKSNCSVKQAHDFVRGLSPYPGAWINIVLPGQTEKQTLKIFETEKEIIQHSDPVGTLVSDLKKTAKIALSDGYLILKQIQVPNKKRMEIGEYLRGIK